MIRTFVLLFSMAAALHAQRGAELFRTTCAVAYCHGPNGTAGKAPQLAGRSFTAETLAAIIRSGKPARGMPSFNSQLKADDIQAITQYILSLAASDHAGAPGESDQPRLSPAAEKGRVLFFDAVRMGGCGRCHEIYERGFPIGPDLRKSAGTDLRAGSTKRLHTATPTGEEPFPATILEQTGSKVRIFDLSSPLPVLRTFSKEQVSLKPGGTWSHAESTRDYSDAEMQAIAVYLQAVKLP